MLFLIAVDIQCTAFLPTTYTHRQTNTSSRRIMMKNQIMLSLVVCSLFIFHCSAMESEITSKKSDPFATLPPESLLNTSLLNTVYDYTLQANEGYVDVPHAPLIIMFSGSAGMGKTTAAKKLQKELNILRFNGDDTRNFLKTKNSFHVSQPPEVKMGKILNCFSHFVANVHEKLPNHAIIFDESIDRQKPPVYDIVSKIAEQYEYPQFVIRLKVAKKVAFDRIMRREQNIPENTEHYKKNFDAYYQVYEDFDTNVVNYFLESKDSEEFSYVSLLEEVQKRIDSKNKD